MDLLCCCVLTSSMHRRSSCLFLDNHLRTGSAKLQRQEVETTKLDQVRAKS